MEEVLSPVDILSLSSHKFSEHLLAQCICSLSWINKNWCGKKPIYYFCTKKILVKIKVRGHANFKLNFGRRLSIKVKHHWHIVWHLQSITCAKSRTHVSGWAAAVIIVLKTRAAVVPSLPKRSSRLCPLLFLSHEAAMLSCSPEWG